MVEIPGKSLSETLTVQDIWISLTLALTSLPYLLLSDQVCHSSYLQGIFGQTVNFSPFAFEGKGDECIISKDNQVSCMESSEKRFEG